MATSLPETLTPPVRQPAGDGLSMSGLSELRASNLVDLVFEQVRAAILDKSLAPGLRVTEAGLAKHLNVSKTPVREALLRLRQIGLIEDDGRRGGRVIAPSQIAIEHAFEVREALEAFTAAADVCKTVIAPACGVRAHVCVVYDQPILRLASAAAAA